MGNFRDNRPSGEGQIVYEDGAIMKGHFDSFENVEGVLTLTNGEMVKVSLKKKP